MPRVLRNASVFWPRVEFRPGLVRYIGDQFCPHGSLWLALAALAAVNLAWVGLDPRLSLTQHSISLMGVVAIGTPLVLAYRLLRVTPEEGCLECLSALLLVALFTAFLTQQVNLFSHLMMTLRFPLTDVQLAGWDRALGFDWNAYAERVGASPSRRAVLLFAYSLSIGPALAVIIGFSLRSGRRDRVDELAFLALASGLICVAVAGVLPAASAWNTVASADAKALLGDQSQVWLDQVTVLRGEAPVSLDLGAMEGIATFPSFHTCLALIILWCSRGTRAGLLAGSTLGLAILAATPVYGGHYGVDILGGAAVMAGLVFVWPRVRPERRRAGVRP